MARRPIAFFQIDSLDDALDAPEAERMEMFEAMARALREEIEAIKRDPEGHRPKMIRVRPRSPEDGTE